MSTALRDLILLELHTRGPITDESGQVTSRIRRSFGLPNSPSSNQRITNVVAQLAAEDVIIRRMNDQGTRTYGIELVQPLADDVVTALAAARATNLAVLVGATPQNELDQLIHDCSITYAALQRLARDPERRVDAHGNIAINVAGVIKLVGLPRSASRAIKYYLREMGLAYSLTAVDKDRNSLLWWWRVTNKPLNIDQLRALATGDRSYEATHMARKGIPRASEVTVRYVEPVVRSTDGVNDAPPVTDSIPPNPTPIECPPSVTTTGVTDDVDPFEALVETAEKLEEENEGLHTQIDELRRQIEDLQATHTEAMDSLQASHAEEVAGLKEQIRQLEATLGARRTISDRALGIIARRKA